MAIIVAGLTTAYIVRSAWPDLIVGLGIFGMNTGAALEVYSPAKDEHGAAIA